MSTSDRVMTAFAGLSVAQRTVLMREVPELFYALVGQRREADEKIRREQLELRRSVMRMRVSELQRRGEHVPAWMLAEISGVSVP